MPVFAAYIGSLFSGLVGVFAQFMSVQLAIKFAAYTAWIALTVAFVAGVVTCIQTMVDMLSMFANGSGWWRWFFIGLGMFIPVNGAAIISCQGAIWIATNVYKLQKGAIEKFAA